MRDLFLEQFVDTSLKIRVFIPHGHPVLPEERGYNTLINGTLLLTFSFVKTLTLF